jgi:uncharacterized protein YukE
MEFGLDKCAKIYLRKENSQNLVVDIIREIKELEQGKAYKHLGIEESDSNQPNMNSTVRAAAKIIDELSQSNENNVMKKDRIQNTKARLAESLKEKCEKVMHGQYIRSIDKHLISEEDTFSGCQREI